MPALGIKPVQTWPWKRYLQCLQFINPLNINLLPVFLKLSKQNKNKHVDGIINYLFKKSGDHIIILTLPTFLSRKKNIICYYLLWESTYNSNTLSRDGSLFYLIFLLSHFHFPALISWSTIFNLRRYCGDIFLFILIYIARWLCLLCTPCAYTKALSVTQIPGIWSVFLFLPL